MKISRIFNSLFIWILGGLYMIIWAILLIILALVLPIQIYDPIIKKGSRLLLKIAGIKVRINGLENLNPKRRYIFMANHTNIFDHFVIYSSLPQIGRGLEKASHFWWPFYGWALKVIQMIPIPSEKGTGRTKRVYEALERAVDWLKKHKNMSVIIMPEGTRTRDGKIGKFHRGGFMLAIKSKIPIAPLTVNGLYKIQQKGGFLLNPGTVDIIIHKSIKTDRYGKKDSTVLMDKVYSVISSSHRLEVEKA